MVQQKFFKLSDGNFALVYAGQPIPVGTTEISEEEFLAGVFANMEATE